jgi:hypothetical protein
MNMKISFLISFCFMTSLNFDAFCQNLVPNPSFELFSTCPTTSNYYADLATDWYIFGKTPDYYNSCFPDALPSPGTDVPKSFTGYQMAATGNAYVGFMTYTSHVFWREYIGAQLLSPLQVGSTYELSMKVVFSNDTLAYGSVACNKFGLRFSNHLYSSLNPAPTDNFAHLYANSVLNDTLNWTTISGTFVADSAYTHVMLGNFFDDASIDTVRLKQNPNWVAYYYLDDVYVGKVGEHTNSIETISNDVVRIFPNPTKGEVFIETNKLLESIEVLNALGQKIGLMNIDAQSSIMIEIPYEVGVYYLRMHFADKTEIIRVLKN